MSVPIPDGRFDEAEDEVDFRGTPWLFRDPDAPNPLTIEAFEWEERITKYGPAEFLLGRDRNGKKWSVLIGGKVLLKHMIEGLVEEWDGEAGEFVVVKTLGRVEAGEVVSIKYAGHRDGPNGPYPDFKVVRKPRLSLIEKHRQARGLPTHPATPTAKQPTTRSRGSPMTSLHSDSHPERECEICARTTLQPFA
jgi:hypothetical protein